jgi:aromatic ring hydroxylase
MGVRGERSLCARASGTSVWIAGRKVGDVTQDQALRRPVAAMAMLYDSQIDYELRPKMTIAQTMRATK